MIRERKAPPHGTSSVPQRTEASDPDPSEDDTTRQSTATSSTVSPMLKDEARDTEQSGDDHSIPCYQTLSNDTIASPPHSWWLTSPPLAECYAEDGADPQHSSAADEEETAYTWLLSSMGLPVTCDRAAIQSADGESIAFVPISSDPCVWESLESLPTDVND